MSLRLRVVSLMGAVLLLSVILGALVAGYQVKQSLRAELGAGLTGAEQTVRSAFEDLPNSDHQSRDLRQLVATFNGNRHVRATLIDVGGKPAQSSHTLAPRAEAPAWFRRLLGPIPNDIEVRPPNGVGGVFAIRLTPTAAIDIGDAWDEFYGVILVLLGSSGVGLVLVYLVIGTAFRPLRSLSTEFARIGTGDYGGRVDETGPPELLHLQRGFNIMASQLAGATDRNRLLTEQLLTIQDEERADIARDLHDDIGPHLFGVNIDAEMIARLNATGRYEAIPTQIRSIQTAVGHMQRQVRDLLGRLRPTRLTEFGLNAAIRDLEHFWTARRPDIAFDLTLPKEESAAPDSLKDTVYRVVQEAANNAIKHGDPKAIQICIEVQNDSDLVVMVCDDGGEPSVAPEPGGLGLIGMRERVAAHGGSLIYGEAAGGAGWSVVARLPLNHSAYARPSPLEKVS